MNPKSMTKASEELIAELYTNLEARKENSDKYTLVQDTLTRLLCSIMPDGLDTTVSIIPIPLKDLPQYYTTSKSLRVRIKCIGPTHQLICNEDGTAEIVVGSEVGSDIHVKIGYNFLGRSCIEDDLPVTLFEGKDEGEILEKVDISFACAITYKRQVMKLICMIPTNLRLAQLDSEYGQLGEFQTVWNFLKVQSEI